mmetsp:Transcript_23151/g.71149  ORF Transcript_23151/g.71149 Transcript_23151/m.71149 type:complete len:194 (+) Transcript_23151:52-633(+)
MPLGEVTNKMEAQEQVRVRGKVKMLVLGLENMGLKGKKSASIAAHKSTPRGQQPTLKKKKEMRWAKDVESPMPSHESHTVAPAVLPKAPAPGDVVAASLLRTSEEHARGLQRTNERLQEDLVAAEMRAEAAERQRLDFEARLREEVELRERAEARLEQKHDGNRVATALQALADAQLEYLERAIDAKLRAANA